MEKKQQFLQSNENPLWGLHWIQLNAHVKSFSMAFIASGYSLTLTQAARGTAVSACGHLFNPVLLRMCWYTTQLALGSWLHKNCSYGCSESGIPNWTNISSLFAETASWCWRNLSSSWIGFWNKRGEVKEICSKKYHEILLHHLVSFKLPRYHRKNCSLMWKGQLLIWPLVNHVSVRDGYYVQFFKSLNNGLCIFSFNFRISRVTSAKFEQRQ